MGEHLGWSNEWAGWMPVDGVLDGLVGCLRHTPDARGQAELLINSLHFFTFHWVSGAFTDITSHIYVVTPSVTSGGSVTSGLQTVTTTVTSCLKSLYIFQLWICFHQLVYVHLLSVSG